MARLKGDALLEHVKSNLGTDRDQVIQEAGYVAYRNGRMSLQRTDFFQALSAAQGLDIGPTMTRSGNGKQPTFRLKVGPKGMVPVGSAYTGKINLSPGDYVQVEVDGDCLVLSAADS